jgi:hypothetical protein
VLAPLIEKQRKDGSSGVQGRHHDSIPANHAPEGAGDLPVPRVITEREAVRLAV